MPTTYHTKNEFGEGVVLSWASLLDDNTREQAEKISRCPVIDGHVALMPDAHFGYGPPVGTAMRTRGAVMPYAVGVDIGCGMIAAKTSLERGDFEGKEGALLGRVKDGIPSGVGKQHERRPPGWDAFVKKHGWPPGVDNVSVMGAALQKRHGDNPGQVRDELMAKVKLQFGTLGAGNHFVEVCESVSGVIWLVLHSGSRGVGNVLASAHVKRARGWVHAAYGDDYLEDKDFAFLRYGTEQFDAYMADLAWCQKYAMANRQAMMNALLDAMANTLWKIPSGTVINCHHNYVEEVEPDVWLTRKGAINAEDGVMGIIPGSMGAKTYIVRGLGCAEAYNTAPHGAGRTMSRGEARRSGDVAAFRERMAGKVWQDRDAEKLLDEAPGAYKPVDVVIADSRELACVETSMLQFINYKGL